MSALEATLTGSDGINPSDIAFEPVGDADMPDLAQLYIQMYRAHDADISAEAAEAKLKLVLDTPHQQGLIFRHRGRGNGGRGRGDRPVGFAIWADMGDHTMIRNYLIDEDLRGRGLGAALLARLRAEHLPAHLPTRLEASANGALAFWKAQGFHVRSSGMRTDALVQGALVEHD